MSDEKPVSISKRKLPVVPRCAGNFTCIVHYAHSRDTEIQELSDSQFETIRNAVRVRQMQSSDCNRLDDICGTVPDTFDSSLHGTHRWCYRNFTNVSRFRTSADSSDLDQVCTSSVARRSDRSSTSTSTSHGALFPQNECLFCCKGPRKFKGVFEGLVKCLTAQGESLIKDCAALKQDHAVLAKIGDIDLRAKEARYHESCRREYVRRIDRQHHVMADGNAAVCHTDLRAAHNDTFDRVCQYVHTDVIQGKKVVRVAMLRDMYLQHMATSHEDFYNPDYTSQKLKTKLIARFGQQLTFWLPQPTCKSELVFSSELDIGEAVETAFDASTSDSKILSEAAAILRRQIKEAHSSASDMPWPPTAEYLESRTVTPTALTNFLSKVISGKSASCVTERTARLSNSIAEDICSATTHGRWTMPKHLLLGMSLRHLTGSADVLSILNRYGHCQSYDKVLELDTALAAEVQRTDSMLPSNISTTGNVVSHLCWDNFDINEETPTGSGTTHTTHGIIIQEVPSTEVTLSLTSNRQQTRERSFNYKSVPLKPCYSARRVEPVLSSSSSTAVEEKSPALVVAQSHRQLLWAVCRGLFNSACTVPDWNGWISKTTGNTCEIEQSRIGYMKPILHPITEYATVQECLMTSMEVTQKLNQSVTFVTFDYAAARIAFDIVWDKPAAFSNVIVHLGAFHTMCSYMGALGKMMAGSGFEEVLIEAGACASGSINQVMNGSHYNRAMRVHKLMVDALERLLLNEFTRHSPIEVNEMFEFETLAACPSFESLIEVMSSTPCITFLEKYSSFKDAARNGDLGQTGQFWMAYHDSVWILLSFLEAVKENDLQLYLTSLRAMCALMFSSDHLHYARYLSVYHTELVNRINANPEVLQLLQTYGISVSRSVVPGCRNPIDLTIEQTVNRSAKTAGGIVGFSRNANAYYRWCLARHKRASFLEATLQKLDMVSDSVDIHKTNRPAEMKRSEKDVCNLVAAFQNFLNPFTVSDHTSLYCVSSGKPATSQVADDLLQYTKLGEQAAAKFIADRLQERTTKFHAPMKKLRLKSFQSMAVKRTLTTTQKKVVHVTAERNVLGQLLMLAKRNDVSFEKLFQFPLGPVPLSLGTTDGSFIKTNKAQLLHLLEDQCVPQEHEYPKECTQIVDGNALLQSMVRLPHTFCALARAVFNSLPKAGVVHFVTDCYRHDSIKDVERSRRGSSATYQIGGRMTKVPRDFASFMLNAENKTQLIRFLLAEWQLPEYAQCLHGRTIFFVCEEMCYSLHSADGCSTVVSVVDQLCSSQEEADTRIILHCLFAAESMSGDGSIVVRSPDTDVFVLLLAYASDIRNQVFFDTGTGTTRRLLAVTDIAAQLGENVVNALPGFHAFTGCDTSSAFVRRGKRRPFSVMQKSEEFMSLFHKLGTVAAPLSIDILRQLEHYVCCMYGYPQYRETSAVRSIVFQSRYAMSLPRSASASSVNGIDLSLLPPCSAALKQHCLRASYQAFIWRHSHIAYPAVPSPDDCGWFRDEEGRLHIQWIEGDIMPQQLVDILDTEGAELLSDNTEETDDGCTLYQCVEEDMEIDNVLDMICEEDVNEV